MRITDQCYAVCMADSPKRSLLYGRRDVQGSHAQNHVEAKQVMSVALAVNQRRSAWSSGEGLLLGVSRLVLCGNLGLVLPDVLIS